MLNWIPGVGEVAVLEQPQHLGRGRAAQLCCGLRGCGGGGHVAPADRPLPVLGEELERRRQVPHLGMMRLTGVNKVVVRLTDYLPVSQELYRVKLNLPEGFESHTHLIPPSYDSVCCHS